jgi:hypothetical protein
LSDEIALLHRNGKLCAWFRRVGHYAKNKNTTFLFLSLDAVIKIVDVSVTYDQ